MKNLVRNLLNILLPSIVYQSMKIKYEKMKFANWTKKGCPDPPPPLAKQNIIAEYQQKYGCKVLIETGTLFGDMVEAQKKRFNKIISIELSVNLLSKAQKRFKDYSTILILQGDSGKVLPEILQDINEPALFWLDGHYSGGITAKGDKDCPIFEELEAIFNSKINNHILLIDDARFFNGKGDYPSVDELDQYIRSKNENYQFEIKHDIIRYFC